MYIPFPLHGYFVKLLLYEVLQTKMFLVGEIVVDV